MVITPLRATTIVIVGREITLEREPSKKKQRTYSKKYAKRIKSDKKNICKKQTGTSYSGSCFQYSMC